MRYAMLVDELDSAVRAYRRAEKAEKDTRAALHAVIRKVLTERANERGAQADVARRTGYTRERLRQIMKEDS
jgi:hypothetical protein